MLTCISGIGEKTKHKLNDLGIFTPIDLIMTFPKKYLDLSEVADVSLAEDGDFCLADIEIVRTLSPVKRGRLQVFKAFGNVGENVVELVWFNQNYISKIIEKGQSYLFYGKCSMSGEQACFVNPIFEKKGIVNSQFVGIQPIYRTKGLLSQKIYKKLVATALSMRLEWNTIIEESLEKKYNFLTFVEAINQLHNPFSVDKIKQARERVNIEMLVKRLAAFELIRGKRGANLVFNDNDAIDKIIEKAKFELSFSQKKAVDIIKNHLRNITGDNFMLCGDVGSGKTIVAFAISNFVIANGYQVAMMAPTEILAIQHYDRARILFNTLNVEVALITANTSSMERKNIFDKVKSGKIQLIIGTHSLLNEKVEFSAIGLVVIDEQHKFGVSHRTQLLSKGPNCPILTLTATPIPRSLQLIAYGEIELINLEKRYHNNISTFIVNGDKRKDMFDYIAKLCLEGSKAVIIAPRIEDNEGVELNSVKKLYDELSSASFCNLKVGCIHGKLGLEEKNRLIDRFCDNKLSIIISTSVLEVGVDLPDLSIIAIMNAERFGLATLHQLRGRVGRQGQDSMCFLYTESNNTQQLERLLKIKECNNGREIAEFDYKIRGAGKMFGTQQVGREEFGFIDAESLELAKDIVQQMNVQKMADALQGELVRNGLEDISFT